jgi:class 3 adenylate cyclase
MEANGEAGRVNISESTYHRVKDCFRTERRGTVQVKHKGALGMYFLESRGQMPSPPARLARRSETEQT